MKIWVFFIPCSLVPYSFAIWFSHLGGQYLPVATPCGLLGMSAGFILILVQFYAKRIGQLERKLEEGIERGNHSPKTSAML